MDVEIVNAIKEVLLEAVKVIGPAIVAGIAAYKAASIQYKLKLQELDKSNQFKAAEKLFELRKEWHKSIASGHKELKSELVQLQGMIAAGKGNSELMDTISSVVRVYENRLPFALSKIERDFCELSEEYTIERDDLIKAKELYNNLPEPTDNAIEYINALIAIYSAVNNCNALILAQDLQNTMLQFSKDK